MQFIQLVDTITRKPFLVPMQELNSIMPHTHRNKDGETYEGCILAFKPVMIDDKMQAWSHMLNMSYSQLKNLLRKSTVLIILEGDSISWLS